MRIISSLLAAAMAALLFSSHAGAAAYVGNAKAGEAAFRKCASCHQVGRYAQAGYGPQLNGIIGRKAASTPDFKYSEAMKKSGIVWTEQKLAAYLRAPHDVVPGTSMRFWGIGDDQQIADLLVYMREFR
ncbi:cytochrome c [Duganella sp. CF517]|uniref:c-type cytochrome n=1 Tax=Duganella sp. CF517 TaxID=1881038 RepID=UPI0008B655D1|nr:cytochrome c [Duganella sp. CF517]